MTDNIRLRIAKVAVDVIDTHGWIKGDMGNDKTGYCANGAIDRARHLILLELGLRVPPPLDEPRELQNLRDQVFQATEVVRERMARRLRTGEIERGVHGDNFSDIAAFNDHQCIEKDDVRGIMHEVLSQIEGETE